MHYDESMNDDHPFINERVCPTLCLKNARRHHETMIEATNGDAQQAWQRVTADITVAGDFTVQQGACRRWPRLY